MNSNTAWNDLNDGGVDRMVQGLYNLKHFGENLKNLKHGITTALQATYRERPYTVKRKIPKKLVQVAQRPPAQVEHHPAKDGQGSGVKRRPNWRPSQRHGRTPLPEEDNQGGKLAMIKRIFAFE
jgi:hypothetical protein